MSIVDEINKAANRHQGDIDAAEFTLKGKKQTLAMVQKECDRAEEALLSTRTPAKCSILPRISISWTCRMFDCPMSVCNNISIEI